MLKSYLSKKFHFTIISILTFIGLLGAALSFWATILFYIVSLIAFRKERPSREREEDSSLLNRICSPANGRVVAIKHATNCAFLESKAQEIKIVIPWWKETGIYLPKNSEIKDISFNKGVPYFTHFISLEDPQGRIVGLGLTGCRRLLLGGRAKINIAPGDRGRARGQYRPLAPWRGSFSVSSPKM